MSVAISVRINGRERASRVEGRLSLADYLREHVRLTGTHLGCEHGVCGACTVLLDGEPVRSCITLAAAADAREVTTIEGLDTDPVVEVLREAFTEAHGLQCGYCTPAMLISARDILLRRPDVDEAALRVELSGNICRCTGYMAIVRAVMLAAQRLRATSPGDE